jgi:hypothetical protein
MATRDTRTRDLTLLLGLTVLVKGALLWLCVTSMSSVPFFRYLVTDVTHWSDFLRSSREGLIPYVHFTKEYPVGAGLVYWLLSPLLDPADGRRLILNHGLIMLAFDLLNASLFYFIARSLEPRRALGVSLLFALNLTTLSLSPMRFEAVVVSFVLLGYWYHRHDRPYLAALFWSIGSCVKWYPAVFIAAQEYRAFVVEKRRWQWVGSFLLLGAINLACNLPFALLDRQLHGSADHFIYPYWYHAYRPLYWDTVLGVITLWLGPLSFERAASLLSLGLMIAMLLLRPAMRLEYKGTLVCLAALLVNRLYSPQFHLWFYPLILFGLALEQGKAFRQLLAFFVVFDVLNVLVYPVVFPLVLDRIPMRAFAAQLDHSPWTSVLTALILVRAVVIVAFGCWIIARARRS